MASSADWLTLEQAARLLGMPETSVLGLHQTGVLQNVAEREHAMLFEPEEIERLVVARQRLMAPEAG